MSLNSWFPLISLFFKDNEMEVNCRPLRMKESFLIPKSRPLADEWMTGLETRMVEGLAKGALTLGPSPTLIPLPADTCSVSKRVMPEDGES